MNQQVLQYIKRYPSIHFYFGLIAINFATLLFVFGFLSPGNLDTDGGIFAAIAYKLQHGGTLYVDTWENKPPGIFYTLEIFFSIFSNKIYALYAYSVLGILSLVNALYFTAYSLLKSVFLNLLILSSFLLVSVNSYFMSDGLYTEILGSALLVWSLYAYHLFLEKKSVKHVYISAFLSGWVVWFKEPFIFLLLPIVLMLAFQLKNRIWVFKMFLILMLPSVLFFVALALSGSFNGFIEMELNNFRYAGTKGELINSNHLETLWGGVLQPLPVVVILVGLYGLKCLFKKELHSVLLFNFALMLGSLLFVFVAHFRFTHYYVPFVIILFYCLFSFLQYQNWNRKLYFIVLSVLLFFSAWKLDQDYIHRFKIIYKSYEADHFTKILSNDSKATLFIDHVPSSEYYIKSEKTFQTFMPVPIGIHFGNDSQGRLRLNKMYEALKVNKPDYLITNKTYSEMAHLFKDQSFYDSNYEKRDSTVKFGETIYLWRKKR